MAEPKDENKKGINEIVYQQDLPKIYVETKKEALTGQVLENKCIIVQGKSLNECKKIYDKLKNEN